MSKNSYVSRSGTEKYYIGILSEDGKEPPEKQNFDETTTIGIDVGIKDFVVLSNEEKIENPKYLKNSLQRLKCLQKRLSKKQKGSNNRTKARLLLSKIHKK